MPGIAGVIDPHAPAPLTDLLCRMVQPLQEDGGGSAAIEQGPWWALGHVSLGIWPGTRSPAGSASGRIHVVLDGQVNNLDRWSLQPVQVAERWQARCLANLLERHGPALIEQLRGTFALAVVDTARRAVHLASSRFGLAPVYYALAGDRFLWASKVRSLLQDPTVPQRLDAAAVAQLLSCEYVLDDRTLIEAVRVLPPATVLTYHEGVIRLHAYWRPVYAPRPMTATEAAERFGDSLSQAVNRVMDLGVPVGVPLSGGLDSRTIAASIAPAHRPFDAFSFGFPWSDDILRSRQVAKRLRARHHIVPSSPSYLPQWAPVGVRATDGQVSCAHYQILQVTEAIASRVRIMLDGLGGARYRNTVSPLCAGSSVRAPLESDAAFKACMARHNTGVPRTQLAALLAPLEDASAADTPWNVLRDTWQASRAASPEIRDRLHYVEFQHRIRRFAVYGSTHLRTHVEVAFPYMDEELVDLLLQIPGSLRADNTLFTNLYRRRWPALGRIIYAATGLPILNTRMERAVHWRLEHAKWRIKRLTQGRIRWPDRKMSTNYPGWFRTALAPWLLDLLFSPQAASRQVVDTAVVQQLWQEHHAGAANHTWALGALATLELWLRQLKVDGSRTHVDAVCQHHHSSV